MTSSGPTGDDNPFGGLPFFGDLGKLLGGLGGGQQGGLQWDAARQLAVQLASGGEPEPNIDPLVRMDIEQIARVADLQIANKTGLTTTVTGAGVQVIPVTRTQWVQRSLDAFKPLFESLASSIAAPPPAPEPPDPAGESDPFSAMLGQLMGAMSPMLLGMTAGGMIGHLAQRSFGQYDLPIPRQPSDELLLVLPNVTEFADDWSIDHKDLFLWLCLHEIAHHAVLAVPHVRATLDEFLRSYAAGFSTDTNALVERLESVDISDPSALANVQDIFGDPEVLLGAIQSEEQRELLPRFEALIAVIVGYVDFVMDEIGGTLVSRYDMITEAIRRRRVQADESDKFVARLFGLELGQGNYDAGSAFVEGVVEREGFEALDALWRDVRSLPTPNEVAAPGLWLARLELD